MEFGLEADSTFVAVSQAILPAKVGKIYAKPISNPPGPGNPAFACDRYISQISSWLQDRDKVLPEVSVSGVGIKGECNELLLLPLGIEREYHL